MEIINDYTHYEKDALNNQPDDKIIKLLISNFKNLSIDNKKIYLDTKIEMLKWDYMRELEACKLFDELDMVERYSDLLYMIIMHPILIYRYYENNSKNNKYNLNTRLSVKDINDETYNSYIYDLVNIIHERGLISPLSLVLKKRLFGNEHANLKEEFDKVYLKINK